MLGVVGSRVSLAGDMRRRRGDREGVGGRILLVGREPPDVDVVEREEELVRRSPFGSGGRAPRRYSRGWRPADDLLDSDLELSAVPEKEGGPTRVPAVNARESCTSALTIKEGGTGGWSTYVESATSNSSSGLASSVAAKPVLEDAVGVKDEGAGSWSKWSSSSRRSSWCLRRGQAACQWAKQMARERRDKSLERRDEPRPELGEEGGRAGLGLRAGGQGRRRARGPVVGGEVDGSGEGHRHGWSGRQGGLRASRGWSKVGWTMRW